MQKIIQANEAKLKTATIEVKSLTLNGKQMTLSVFRQLKEEDVFDLNTGELRGNVWGTVNYFWKDCHTWSLLDPEEARDHIHVVWQKGDELRRSEARRVPRYFNPVISGIRETVATAQILIWRLTKHDNDTPSRSQILVMETALGCTGWDLEQWAMRGNPRLDESLIPLLKTVEYHQKEIQDAKIAQKQLENSWRLNYDKCANADHLFIAV